MLEGVIGHSNSAEFFLRDLVKVELVLPQQIETTAESYDVHEEEHCKRLYADENLRDVIHERRDAIDQAEEVPSLNVDQEDADGFHTSLG